MSALPPPSPQPVPAAELPAQQATLEPDGMSSTEWLKNVRTVVAEDTLYCDDYSVTVPAQRMITAYHVSGVEGLTLINTNVCDSDLRDGLLLGLSAASFTTTVNTYNGPRDFLSITPYPRSAKLDSRSHRYTMTFDPNTFSKFHMAQTTERGVRQVHYLLLAKADPFESRLAGFVHACHPLLLNRMWTKFFPQGQANDYNQHKTVVNVFFAHSVGVEYRDRVRKVGDAFEIEAVEPSIWYDRLLVHAVRKKRVAAVTSWLLSLVQAQEDCADCGLKLRLAALAAHVANALGAKLHAMAAPQVVNDGLVTITAGVASL
ncbi:hypothetical protein DYB26_016192 [Aphanomyces astaci]|uniref:Uncharacterized protein n=1 Tax=Aphanomyces astaci TaxID=112090 RepID=A0A418G427_APHAT|nr:hypothetical protein DYB26_016192 [Aphanomyces astaci]